MSSSMSRRRTDPAKRQPIDDDIDQLLRDGPAAATIRPFSDLSLAAARRLGVRWPTLPAEVRLVAVREMTTLGERDVRLNFERALAIAMTDSNADIRAAAVMGLWEAKSDAVQRQLLRLAPDEPDWRVRTAMFDALGRCAEYRVVSGDDGLSSKTASLLLDAAITDTSEAARLAAMAAASYFQPEELIAVIESAFDDGSDDARESALVAMGRFGGSRWASRVIDGLRSGSDEERIAAAGAAPYIEDQRVVTYLYEAAEDDDAIELQVAAISGLGEIGGREVRKFLEEVQDSPDEQIRDAAEIALANAALLDGVDNQVGLN